MYFIGILRGAAMARFISVAWLHCSRLLLLHQTALTAKRAEAARAVTPILALSGLNGGRGFFAMQSDAIRTQRFADSQIPLAPRAPSIHDPCVWTGRVLQARCDEWRRLVLRFCIRPLNGAVLLLAIMDIRAHPISFSERP